jgi:TRAP-type C4-dicarboxylate transport system permease small subunit
VTKDDSDHSSGHAPVGRLLRVFDCIIDIGGVLAALLLIAVMLATTIKVIFRYGLREGLIGVDQISGTLLLYIALLGAAWVLRRNEHVTIDLLLGHVGPRARWFLTVTSALIGALVCLVVTVFGTLEVVDSIQTGVRIPAEIEMPRAVNLIVIPIGFLLLMLQFLRQAVDLLKGAEAPPPPSASVV